MTAKDIKEAAKGVYNYHFTPNEMQAFEEAICREQRKKDADVYFDLCREYQDEVHNAILTNEKPTT